MTSLPEFLTWLDGHPERVPLDELVTRMKDLRIDAGEIESAMVFSDHHYRRNLLHAAPGAQALILCWKSGQRSPIHDHEGSSCGVRVIRGTATETVFHRDGSGMLRAARTVELREGQVCGSQDSDIHQVSNLQAPGEPLVTLHIYSPPLVSMNTYSLTDGSKRPFVDPVESGSESSSAHAR